MTRDTSPGSPQECEVLCGKGLSLRSTPLSGSPNHSEYPRYAQRIRHRYAPFLAFLPPAKLTLTLVMYWLFGLMDVKKLFIRHNLNAVGITCLSQQDQGVRLS